MLSTLREQIGHAAKFYFGNKVRRQIRHLMKIVYDNLNQYEKVIRPQLTRAIEEGDIDKVTVHFNEAIKALFDNGEILLIEDEINLEIIQLRVQNDVKSAKKFIIRLKSEVGSARIADNRRKELWDLVAVLEKKIGKMYEDMLETIMNEHYALTEQIKAANSGSDKINHWAKIRAKGLVRLTTAMDEAFSIPRDKKKIGADLNHMEEVEKATVMSLETMHAHAEAAAENWEIVKKNEVEFDKAVCLLIEHVTGLYSHFEHIMKVFVMYFFFIQIQRKDLGAVIQSLEDKGFPPEKLEEFEGIIAKKEQEVVDRAKTIDNMGKAARDVK